MKGDSSDPQMLNLVNPQATITLNGMTIDVRKLAQAAEKLGAEKLDVLSIGGYRNSKGQWVPDYDTVRIEKRG